MNYAKLYVKRSDGRYQGAYYDEHGKRHLVCDKDPQKLFEKIEAKTHPEAPTFGSVADEWERNKTVSYKTAESYVAPLRILKEHFGEKNLDDITPQDISAFLLKMRDQGFARRTVQQRRDICNMIYNYAILQGYTKYNPVAAVPMPKNLQSSTREPPSADAIKAVIDNKDTDPFGQIPFWLLMTGMRRQELLALRYEDIDKDAKLIHINRAVEFQGEKPVIKETKTKTSVRTIPLLDVLQVPKGKGYVFGSDGELMSRWEWRSSWDGYCKRIGYHFTAHQLRHAFASRLFELDIAPKDAQELLGHANIETTMNVYTHISQNHKSQIANKLNEQFLAGNLPSDLPSK